MLIKVLTEKCPECGQTLDFHILSLWSLLGPPSIKCHRCGLVSDSGRFEWREADTERKRWYLKISLVYVLLVGFLGGYSYGITRDYLLGVRVNWEELPDFKGAKFLTGFAVWGAAVVLFQTYRVYASIGRTEREQNTPTVGFFNLQTWLQIKFLILLLLIPFFAWLAQATKG